MTQLLATCILWYCNQRCSLASTLRVEKCKSSSFILALIVIIVTFLVMITSQFVQNDIQVKWGTVCKLYRSGWSVCPYAVSSKANLWLWFSGQAQTQAFEMKVLEGLQAFCFVCFSRAFQISATEVSAKLTQLESPQINNKTPGGKIPEFSLNNCYHQVSLVIQPKPEQILRGSRLSLIITVYISLQKECELKFKLDLKACKPKLTTEL